MKLNKIEFILENCDYIELPAKYIANFFIGDIKTTIMRSGNIGVRKQDVAQEIFIMINKDANKYKKMLDPRFITEEETKETQNWYRIFDRLAENDITSIELYLDEEDENEDPDWKMDNHIRIYTNWCGDNEYFNDAQKTSITSGGHLGIMISPKIVENDEEFNKLIQKIAWNNEKHLDFIMDLFQCGD